MKELFKRHWITLLGAVFTFLAFSYLLKYAVDMGWISDQLKITLGLIAGSGFIIGGVSVQQRGKNVVNEILSGLGVSLLYTTFAFAGIYFSMWKPMTVFLCMVAVTLAASVYSYKFNLRVLMNLGCIGALIAPLVMRSEEHIFTLFLYLLVINSAAFFVSVSKRWTELRFIPFIGTWILFTVYYIHFQPENWMVPFRYSLAAFIFYIIGFIASSWKEDKKFNGLNLYLGIVNGVVFAIWSLVIMNDVTPYSLILGGIGIIYIAASLIVYGAVKKFSIPVISKFFAGLLLLLIACNDIGSGLDIKPMISVYIWTLVAAAVLIVGQIKNIDYLKLVAVVIWVLTGSYWFSTTWTTPLGIWFDTFIPVLNFSGFAWVLLAVFGFYVSLKVNFEILKGKDKDDANYYMSNVFSILSHLVVGGLLTFQIDNLWEFYKIEFIDLELTYSITWGIYALLIFLWGAYSKQALFRWFGSGVLVLVAVKTIFFDLAGSDTIAKIFVLFILGIITFAISFVNNMWKGEKKEEVCEMVQVNGTTEVDESGSFYKNCE